LTHEPAEGDGVRGRIVSSRAGLLVSAKAHHDTSKLDHPRIEVEAGETLDFIVDLTDTLSHDQFLWKIRIEPITDDPSELAWDAQRDFRGEPTEVLDPWEQLAQVLMAANEFMFID
jgi:hypothetical protein